VISGSSVLCLSASDSGRAFDSPLRTTDATGLRRGDHEMASDNCDLVWRSLCSASRSRVLRHKDQKSFRAVANTESQTPEEEIDAYSSAREFAKTKESFADSISQPDVEGQVKAQETFADAGPGRKSISQSSGNCDSFAW
jgi:hypothetical protein